MAKKTKVSWCHHTFNPWWVCEEVSPGCDHCYARTFAHRLGFAWGPDAPRRFFDEPHWQQPLAWDRAAAAAGERRRVFCASMSDWADDRPELVQPRADLWLMISETLLLTKRPENAARMLPWMSAEERRRMSAIETGSEDSPSWSHPTDDHLSRAVGFDVTRPWPNVWLGVTTEDAEWAWRRLRVALRTPAVKHFASYEPALGPVDFTDLAGTDERGEVDRFNALAVGADGRAKLDQVIFGDEDGHHRRPADPAWVRSTRDQCVAHDVRFHFKQWAGADEPGISGAREGKRKIHLPLLDGRQWAETP